MHAKLPLPTGTQAGPQVFPNPDSFRWQCRKQTPGASMLFFWIWRFNFLNAKCCSVGYAPPTGSVLPLTEN